jgi:hypothetical protein
MCLGRGEGCNLTDGLLLERECVCAALHLMHLPPPPPSDGSPVKATLFVAGGQGGLLVLPAFVILDAFGLRKA